MGQEFFGNHKAIAGAALAGLGIIVLCVNLDGAATQLTQLLGNARGETLGVLPTVVLVAARVMQAYASDHRRFVQGFFEHLLVLFWPLLLVIAGKALSQDGFTDKGEALPRPDKCFRKKSVEMSISLPLVRRVSSAEVSGDRDRREAQLRARNYKETQRCGSW
jgi:hypothetical protein